MTDVQDQRLKFGRLRRFNIIMGFFHAIQGVAILLLTNDFALPVTASFLNGPPGEEPPQLYQLFEVRIGWAVAAFIFMSALAHRLIASPGIYPWYTRNLERGRHQASCTGSSSRSSSSSTASP